MWSFDVFFDLRLNEWLSKQSGSWWFEMPSHPSWRHSNDTQDLCLVVYYYSLDVVDIFVPNVTVTGPSCDATTAVKQLWWICVSKPFEFIIRTHNIAITMMASSNNNIFRITGPLCGESSGYRWFPLTKASDAGHWCFLWSAPEQTVEQAIETLVILESIEFIMPSL